LNFSDLFSKNFEYMKASFFLMTVLILSVRDITNAQIQSTSKEKKHEKTKLSPSDSSSYYFTLKLSKGEKLANVFSRTIAYHSDGFSDLVQRVSGTGNYIVLENDPQSAVFESHGLYDGRPEGKGNYTVRTNGQSIYNGKSYQDASASGVLFNSFIWGVPPATIRDGDQWDAIVNQPWELGCEGKQLITVVQIDKLHHSITLKREGSGEGFYQADPKQVTVTLNDGKKITLDIVPGRSSWSGYTSIKNGVIISDELLVTRPISLKNDSLNFTGRQREYILLNAMPSE
jgi:hypothetical protein